jgi:transcriptional regulator with XRE-family HTH domain
LLHLHTVIIARTKLASHKQGRYYGCMREQRDIPFKSLGIQLKELRQKLQETVAEVAGAVEIDESALNLIEQGSERPSEDILMLLISHFGMHEDEATNLWVLAGYDQPQDDNEVDSTDDTANHSVVVMMTIDTRILYSDQATISADKNGVVLNFLQASNVARQPQQLPIARVGMSYDQAHELLHILQNTMSKAAMIRQPKGLPAPRQSMQRKPKKTDTN